VELLDLACGVDQPSSTGPEGMGVGADLDDHQRVAPDAGVCHSMVRELVTVERVRKAAPVMASWNTTGW
jgi:hypothetical protein